MKNKTPQNEQAPQSKAKDKKRGDALRENLLKRKQQSRDRKGK